VDFRLTAKRNREAALRFSRKALKWNGTPEKITIDKSGANAAALESLNAATEAAIEIHQIKYFKNIVEQDHRAIKRLVRPMLGFKSFRSAAVTLAGIELMHRSGKASCGRQAKCVRSGNFIRWPDKPRRIHGSRISGRKICDRTYRIFNYHEISLPNLLMTFSVDWQPALSFAPKGPAQAR
jgi:putative transposase